MGSTVHLDEILEDFEIYGQRGGEGATQVKTIEELDQSKVPIIRVDGSLNKYDNQVLFPEKVETANKALRTIGLPKTAEKSKE